MKRFAGIAAAAVFMAVFLAGCHVRVDSGEDGVRVDLGSNGIHVDVGDIDEGDTTVDVGPGGIDIDSNRADLSVKTAGGDIWVGDDKVKKEFNMSPVAADGLSRFEAGLEMGDIVIDVHDKPQIDVAYTVRINGKRQSVCEKILELITCKAEIKDGTIKLIPYINETRTDILKYVEREYGRSYKVSICIKVTLPSDITELEIEDSMGDITISNVTASVDVDTAMGDIILDGVVFSGDSVLASQMGDVCAGIKTVDGKKASVLLETCMGDVSFNADGADVKIKSSDCDMFNCDIEALVGGLLSVEAKTDMGDAEID